MEDFYNFCFRGKGAILLQGQFISVLIAGTGVFATLLSNTHPSTNFPTLMNLFNYLAMTSFLLFVHRPFVCNLCDGMSHSMTFKKIPEIDKEVVGYDSPFDHASIMSQQGHSNNSILADIEQKQSSMKTHDSNDHTELVEDDLVVGSYKLYALYFLAAILDLEANYLIVSAYNFTTITSVMLLDCFTIPSSMLLSRTFLGYHYLRPHLIGASLCIAGLSCIVLSDYIGHHGANSRAKDPIKGDIYCLIGAFCYASSNVLQEYLVKRFGRNRYIGTIGLFGVGLASIQCGVLELPALLKIHFPWCSYLYTLGFVTCMFAMYICTSTFLVDSDATLFNLSLLTSDVYAVIFNYVMYGVFVHWLYFLAFGLVVAGLSVYHLALPPTEAAVQYPSRLDTF